MRFDNFMHPALLPIASGLILGLFTLRQIRLAQRLQRTGVEVLGRVVSQRQESSRSGNHFIPTIRFTTCFGQAIEAESAGDSTNLEFFDGDEVVVYYDPNEPIRFLLAQQLNLRSKYGQMSVVALMLMLGWFAAL